MENIHGGDIYTEGILKNRELIDFSSNINPYGVSDTIKVNIENFWQSIVRYPDFKYRALKKSITKYIAKYDNIEINDNQILLGNGAVEAIDALMSTLKSITIVIPSFAEYENSACKYIEKINFVKLTENMKYNYEEIKKSISHTQSIILGNPNNPSGNIIDKDFFEELLLYCENNNKKIIVDEAFVEFAPDGTSVIKLIEKYKCLFVIRAFTKFFGMPGARLGYCLSSDSEILKQLSTKQLTWNINSFAEFAAINAFEDSEYINKTKLWIKKEIPYMIQNLRNKNLEVYNTNCNFVLCKLKNCTSQQFYDKMMSKNILIRRCDNFRTLDNNYIRLAIKSRELNNILLNNIK